MIHWVRLHYKLLLRRWSLIPSFCKRCGVDVRDYQAPEDVWQRVEPHIKHGAVLCYNCFCDICSDLGLPSTWYLTASPQPMGSEMVRMHANGRLDNIDVRMEAHLFKAESEFLNRSHEAPLSLKLIEQEIKK